MDKMKKGMMHSYNYDVETLARRELQGQNIEETLVKWAGFYDIDPAQMRTDVEARKAKVLASQAATARRVERDRQMREYAEERVKGETFYQFQIRKGYRKPKD